MNQDRREVLHVVAAASAAVLAGAPASAANAPAQAAFTPAKGKPGEFDFLTGEWRIKHRRLPAGAKVWDEFEGEATCWSILGGIASVEELRIPARNFSGMGLRLLDVNAQIWYDFWVNAKSGVLGAAGTPGGFENGAGIFISEDVEGGRPVQYRGMWDLITPTSCRWRQSTSRDGGRTWEDSWVMEWRRV